MNAKLILSTARQFNCTPSVVINAIAGSKWPHPLLKHDIRSLSRSHTGARRISPERAARLRQRDRGFWLAWSGEKLFHHPVVERTTFQSRKINHQHQNPMRKSARKALLARLNGEVTNKFNARKHPILSGAVKVVSYEAPHWRYGKARG